MEKPPHFLDPVCSLSYTELSMERLVPAFGFIAFLFMAWALSSHRRLIPWRVLGWGVTLQFVSCWLILGIPVLGVSGPLRFIFQAANDAVDAILDYNLEGARFVFGDLVNPDKFGYIFAFQVLPTIIFMASLMSVLYYLGVMQLIIRGLSWIMIKTLRTSGAETLSNAANIFVGQTEAPLLIKPFVAKMTRSELFNVMVAGMANVAGGVLAAYVGLLRGRIPDIAGHLLTASVVSSPASFVISKLMVPETEVPETQGGLPKDVDVSPHSNLIEAAAVGAGEGLEMALNVAAMLIAFIALVALSNGLLHQIGTLIHFDHWGQTLTPAGLETKGPPQLSLQLIMGWLFAPIAALMGIPLHESALAGSLLGEKVTLNEFYAYLHMSQLGGQLSDKAFVILSYALCGFANFSSIAIQIGGIGALAPERRSDIAGLGLKCVIGGSLSSFTTACVVAMFL
jgi:CNT family concentrative nucleoside transporter